jgi:intein/homing endonuclease
VTVRDVLLPATVFREPAFNLVYGASKLGKCLSESSEILLADGRIVRLGDLAAAGGNPAVVALNRDYKLVPAPVSAFYANGKKKVVRVETADGRAITVTTNHPLLTQRGWVNAGDLTERDLLAVPRTLPFFGGDDTSEAYVKALAYYLADGSFVDGAVTITESNPEKVADLRAAVEQGFPDVDMVQATLHGEPTITFRLRRKAQDRRTSTLHAMLRTRGLDSKRAGEKFVPDAVFRLRRPLVALFLSRYLGCDGAVHSDGTVSFSSASERMARQVSHLLLRFGVFGKLRTKVVKDVTYWEWQCLDATAVETLRREVGVFTKPIPPRAVGPSKHDRLPVKWDEIPSSHRSRPKDRKATSYITRHMGEAMFDVGEEVHKLAHSDLLWRPVASVTPAGVETTYDLTVPLHHTFVANDVVAHNTTDLIYSFPEAFFIAPPGALKPSVNVVGWDVPDAHRYDARSIPDAIRKLREVSSKPCPHCGCTFTACGVDDFSLLAELSFALLERVGPASESGKLPAAKSPDGVQRTGSSLTGWQLWGGLADEVLDFRDTARRVGVHVSMNCHETAAKMVNGLTQRGGPKLPGRLPESLPAGCDLVLRATGTGAVVGAAGKLGWTGVYRCNPNDPGFVSGDRHGVTPDMSPMNIAEILRAAGYTIPRPKALAWMDEAVAFLAASWMKADPTQDSVTMKDAAAWLMPRMKTLDMYQPFLSDAEGLRKVGLHVRWVLRDAYDRVILARARANPLAIFGL